MLILVKVNDFTTRISREGRRSVSRGNIAQQAKRDENRDLEI